MKLLISFIMFAFCLVAAEARSAPSGDTLSDVKKKGYLVVGVRDSVHPFGFLDPQTDQLVGYDIDYAVAIAKKIGVKIKFKPVTPVNRIPLLQNGEIDLIAATMTKTMERAKLVDFSFTYFMTGQKFITRKEQFNSPGDFAGKVVGVAKGTAAGETLVQYIPTVKVRYFDNYLQVLQALRQKEVVALSTDEAILVGLYLEMPDKEEFEIARAQISGEAFGLAVRKGDKVFLKYINDTLMEMEKSGEADRIFEKWFGQNTQYKMKKNFNRGIK